MVNSGVKLGKMRVSRARAKTGFLLYKLARITEGSHGENLGETTVLWAIECDRIPSIYGFNHDLTGLGYVWLAVRLAAQLTLASAANSSASPLSSMGLTTFCQISVLVR
jgi:hypothetical protein